MVESADMLHAGARRPADAGRMPGGLRLPSVRELALFAIFLLVGALAFGAFDEWRLPITIVYRAGLSGGIAFFAGRAFWSWGRTLPAALAGRSAGAGIAFSVVGWLGVALAIAVTGMSGENYALIVIAPLTFLFGVFTTLGGVIAVGLGIAAVAAGLAKPAPRAGLVLAGLACGLFNAGHTLALVWVYWGRG